MPDISYLKIDLPENIMRAKTAGDFEMCIKMIDTRLAGDCSAALRERLLIEKERLYRLCDDYPYTREEAIAQMRAEIPDFTEEEFALLELDGSCDFHYFGGEKRYFVDQTSAIIKMHPDLGVRAGKPQLKDDLTGRTLREIKAKGSMAARFRMKASVRIHDDVFVPGETYTVHLPVAEEAAQISETRIVRASTPDYILAPADAEQRTICFKAKLDKNETFEVEYEFKGEIKYFDGYNPPKEKTILYPNALPVCEADLAEKLPHIRFSPYIRMLAEELKGDETDPFIIARNIYDYVTCHVRYSYMPSYALMDDISDYCALNLRGDCGVQAILFISLCRVCGIPARWQSGLTCEPDDAGCHDWAQFYTEKYGWLFADPSFGGAGRRRDDEERRRFFFGNLDIYRMVANREYMAKFVPDRVFTRRDPFDSQTGECESSQGALPHDGFDRHFETVSAEVIG